MSTRAYALFASGSKSQNWLPVVRISLCSALIYLLNFSRFALRAPMPVPKKNIKYTSTFQVTYPALFLLLQIFSSFPSRRANGLPFSSLELAAIEALKLAFNALLTRYKSGEDGLTRQTRRTVLLDASRNFEEQPLHGMDNQECEETTVPTRGVVSQEPADALLTASSWPTVVSASIVWASTTYIVCIFRSIVRKSG